MKFSTGLRNHLLVNGSIRGALNAGYIRIYSGTPPPKGDDAIPAGATLLVEATVDGLGGGLTFEATTTSAGLLQKSSAEVWKGTVLASGLATWFRFVTSTDGGAASTSALRLQGTVSTAGGDMQISDPNLVSGADQKVDFFSIFQPE